MYADMNIYIDNYTLIQTYLYLYIDDDTLDPVGAFMSHGMHIIYAINVYVYTDDDDETLDPVGAFMSRMKEDWEDRLTNNPERYVTKAHIEKLESNQLFCSFLIIIYHIIYIFVLII
jgi:hypothetical protein